MGRTDTPSWANSPSSMRGAARLADLFGQLDEYNHSSTPDYDAIRQDWEEVGKQIRTSLSQHGQEG